MGHHIAHQTAHDRRGLFRDDAGANHRLRLLQQGGPHQRATVGNAGIAYRQMQRTGRYAMAVTYRHGGYFRPALGHQGPRPRGFHQFDRCRLEQPKRFQERFLPLRPDHQRHPRRADVGAFDDDILNRQFRAIIVEIADLELAPGHRAGGFDHGADVDQPQIKRIGNGEDLVGGAQLINPLHRAVEQWAVGRVATDRRGGPCVGVEIGQRHH